MLTLLRFEQLLTKGNSIVAYFESMQSNGGMLEIENGKMENGEIENRNWGNGKIVL